MVAGLWGKKVGMTQVFAQDKAIPVTVIDVSNWLVTQVKTEPTDGYTALQVGQLRERYKQLDFSSDWLKKPNHYFRYLREIKLNTAEGAQQQEFVVGQPVSFHTLLQAGSNVHVVGTSKGAGFAGAVRRHGFAGARASHGSKMGKRPGSLSFMRSQGRVIKGKRLPGHMGTLTKMVRNLEVVKVYQEDKLVLIKGSVPGKAGSLVFIRNA